MKKLIIAIILLFITTLAQADKLQLPCSSVTEAHYKLFKKLKMKLDKDPSKRTKNSWGFVTYENGYPCIYTYEPVTNEELNIVMKIIMGTK